MSDIVNGIHALAAVIVIIQPTIELFTLSRLFILSLKSVKV